MSLAAAVRRWTVVAFAWPLVAAAAPYDLDISWATSGRLPLTYGSGTQAVLLQQDGGLILVHPMEVRRARADGVLDPAFGDGGSVVAPVADASIVGWVQRPDGRFDLVWKSPATPVGGGVFICAQERWHRYSATGVPEAGTVGTFTGTSCLGRGLVADGAGNSYWTVVSVFSCCGTATLRRADAVGNQLDPLDVVSFPLPVNGVWPWVPGRLAVDAQGRVLASANTGGPSRGLAVIRYAGDGRDPSFGDAGVASLALSDIVQTDGALPLADGRVVAYGTANVDGRPQPVLARFTSSGQPDPAFGVTGLATLALARPGELIRTLTAALAPDGRILIAAEMSLNSQPAYTRIARLRSDGQPDFHFGGGGIAPTTFGAGLHSLIVRPTGEILLGLAAEVVQLRGGDLPAPSPDRQRRVVEYFHAGYAHYFMTAEETEIAILDAQPARGWARTGASFDVLDSDAPPLVSMCRFWSDQSFAPKSSHFYTPYAHECTKLALETVWRFEGNVFPVRMPEDMAGAISCAAGTRPLYRAYNDGQSGAPNHRYTTDAAVLDAMIAQGWIMEGDAVTRVFACVPG